MAHTGNHIPALRKLSHIPNQLELQSETLFKKTQLHPNGNLLVFKSYLMVYLWSLIKELKPGAYLFCFFVGNVLLFQNSHALLQVLHNICWRFVRLSKRERHDGSNRGFHCTLPARPATEHKEHVREVGLTEDTLYTLICEAGHLGGWRQLST